ncbi:gamma-glutamylcyclotransferase (GGCT)/AIG2-like uncharacterized protein YtfP [Saonia flava]|uniref:Gamma-glutamylcyclotransferase (GGCT)/AIG2-like uncharacterized protein YtfP n=1 Tax=Saonia flava TaxID=523696 RepID=A0A846QYR9_9FLAO|nr:gamma-glutamylcyclotransferase family protein [Saonia flava]NJB71792.1 gamma-glutamylcyclotransferase (GGCT)/AIG2-like uncharacterized protein YtfP [Saonia flava]
MKISEFLFTYGTLQDPQVQHYIYGRILDGKPDFLLGHKRLKNAVYGKYPLVVKTNHENDSVPGMVYYISYEELLKTDVYETNAYRREKATLKSGIDAWVYVENLD